MAHSRKPGSLGMMASHDLFPARTPGSLGINDAAAPFVASHLGDTPGSLGVNDHATPHRKKTKAHPHKKKHHHKSDPLAAAFERARQLGWLPFFEEAARTSGFTPELLMAVAYRETRLDPKYLQQAGDNGHGYGLMQADIRSFKAWINSGKWKNAKESIAKGAEVLNAKRDEIRSAENQTLTVKTLAGEEFTFTGKPINETDLLHVAVAAYNCGLWAYYHYSKEHDIDRGTTGQNYSREVLQNAPRFKALLDEERKRALPPRHLGFEDGEVYYLV